MTDHDAAVCPYCTQPAPIEDPLAGIIEASAGLYENASEDPNCTCIGLSHRFDCHLWVLPY